MESVTANRIWEELEIINERYRWDEYFDYDSLQFTSYNSHNVDRRSIRGIRLNAETSSGKTAFNNDIYDASVENGAAIHSENVDRTNLSHSSDKTVEPCKSSPRVSDGNCYSIKSPLTVTKRRKTIKVPTRKSTESDLDAWFCGEASPMNRDAKLSISDQNIDKNLFNTQHSDDQRLSQSSALLAASPSFTLPEPSEEGKTLDKLFQTLGEMKITDVDDSAGEEELDFDGNSASDVSLSSNEMEQDRSLNDFIDEDEDEIEDNSEDYYVSESDKSIFDDADTSSISEDYVIEEINMFDHSDDSMDTKKMRYAQFRRLRDEQTREIFNEFNTKVFKNKLPQNMEIIWSNRLLTTAGNLSTLSNSWNEIQWGVNYYLTLCPCGDNKIALRGLECCSIDLSHCSY